MSMRSNGAFGHIDPHGRASNPSGWTHPVTKPTMLFKFHHCIAWDSLRDTWQTLLEHGEWNALEAFMTAAGVTGASAIRGKLHRNEDMTPAELDNVFEKISWPGWNIVQGPGARTDEGGTDIDLFTEGMSALDTERQVTLDLLWKEMSLLLKHVDASKLRARREGGRDNLRPDRVTSQLDRNVSDAAARLERAFGKMAKFKAASFIPWTHSMWDTVEPGFVNKHAIGLWDQAPTFRKTSTPRTVIGNMQAHMRCKKCSAVYDTPAVPPGTIIWCPKCEKQTQVDFSQGV